MLKKMIFIIGVALLLGACTVKEELTFNNNFSGIGMVSYNISLTGEEGENDSTISAELAAAAIYRDSALAIQGISDVRINFDENEESIVFRYKFSNLKALNSLYTLQIFEEAPFMRKQFVNKGKKKLTVTWPVHNLTDEDREAYDDDMMAKSYNYELLIKLPHQVKKSSFSENKITHKIEGDHAFFEGEWSDFYLHRKPLVWEVKM